jgi:hypothetical protein
VTIPENVNAIHSMILDDQRITTKKIEENLVITQKRVGYIIHKSLGLQKLSAKWVSEGNIVSSRQCRSSQSGNYAPEIGISSF